ncbi:MAG: circularly permuted type 2 ATP-grasp protein, partial [Umezawaea sp.]
MDPGRPHADAYDEMFTRDEGVRSAYRALHESIAPSEVADLNARSEALGRAFVDQGIT